MADVPQINSGGETLDIYDVMERFRNDGSCEYLIVEALTQYVRVHGEGDAISRESVENIVDALLIPLGEPLETHAAENFSNGVRHAGKFLQERIRSLPSLPSQAKEMKQAMISVVREIHSRYIERSTGPAAQTNAYFASDQIRYARIVEEVIKALQSVEVK